ncbi:MAG TPA: pyridoxamine 5'-phosphate oxidase family protein [Candidatus Acidoferrum sp.]
MHEPRASRPYWPDALSKSAEVTSSLKPWSWGLERLEKSHNYWIATTRPDRRPHLMIVWGIWWQDAFWFSTGPRTRKAKNIAATPQVVIGTEDADEAIILEGNTEEITDRSVWKQLAKIYNAKYGGDVEPMLMASDGCVFRVQPQIAFAQDEHAENFADAVTRWQFDKE